jgi:hypothetical protein
MLFLGNSMGCFFANQPDVTELNEPISREEIIVAVERVKLRKAAGFDEIPAEVLKNQTRMLCSSSHTESLVFKT